MRKSTAILSAVLALFGSTALSAQKLTLVELNIRSFETVKNGSTQHLIVDDISDYVTLFKSANPDIIFLNEFETGTSRIGRENMSHLASYLDMFAYYIASYPLDIGHYGNAILSKYPIINCGSTPLEYVHVSGEGCYILNGSPYVEIYGTDRRSIGYADILVPDGKGGSTVIRVCCTHLEGREKQANELIEFCSIKNPVYPTILAGDINATRGSACVNLLEGAGEFLGGDYIDLFFGYPKNKWEVLEDSIIPTTIASGDMLSDHQAMKVVVKLK